jgi:hypothetical protein
MFLESTLFYLTTSQLVKTSEGLIFKNSNSSGVEGVAPRGGDLSYPGSKKSTEPKPLHVCPGCLITRIATI